MEYPYWTEALGITMTVSTIAGTVIWAIYAFIDALLISKKVYFMHFYLISF